MRSLAWLLAPVLLLSGCMEGSSSGSDGSVDAENEVAPAVATEPYVVFEQPFMDAYATGAATRDFTLEEPVSALQITVDFGTSAFVEFQFNSPEPCAELGSGAGVFPNSSQWTGECGALPAGDHQLGWTTRGTAQGIITVVAIP